MKRNLTLIVFLFLGITFLYAQTGDEYYNKKDYSNAIIRYKQEVVGNPSKYLNLSKSYFMTKAYDEALDAMIKYKEKASSPDLKYANFFIEMLERNDDYVEVVNLGPVINTDKSDFYPVVTQDGKTIYFISQDRSGAPGGEDIWYSEKKSDGNWDTPKPLNDLNTSSHESIMSISGDGNVAIMFGNYEGKFGSGDLFYSIKTPKGWTMPCNLGGTVNTKSWEAQAMLAADGKTLFFCSTRDGGQGNSDIYVSELTPEGWTKPINLGPTINTSETDGGPYLAADGKTLYFYSDGHTGFGGRDMFMSKKTGDSWTSWSKPVNLGKYINTLEDDNYLSIPASGTKGYTVKRNQADGYGDQDLYEFVLPRSMRPESVFSVYGVVSDENKSPVGSLIRFIDAATNEEYGSAISNFADGVYKISLPPFKKYNVVIDMKGYLYMTDVLDLTNLDQYMKTENLNDRLLTEMTEIKKAQEKIAVLNAKLSEIISLGATNVDEGFKQYEEVIKELRMATANLDVSIKRAKLNWLTEENENLEIRKDFQLQTIKVGATFELKNIFFDSGKATLKDESKTELDKLSEILSKSTISIELGGHTDDVGSEQDNLKLSQDRVNSVMEYLLAKGVKAERIKAVGYGEAQPLATNETEEGRATNRRVEVKITDMDYQKGREGKEVVVEDKGKKEKEKEKVEEQQPLEFDFLLTMQKAAKLGGLPPDSPCEDKIKYLTAPTVTTTTKKKDSKFDLGFDEIDKDENYVFKTFNPYVRNFGLKAITINDTTDQFRGSSFGAGVSFVGDKLGEFYMDYFFMPEDSIKWMAATGFKWNWQFVKSFPLLVTVGFSTNFWQYTSELEGKKGNAVLNIPLGLRFNLPLMDDNLIISPHFLYNWGPARSDFNEAKSTFTTIGLDARYRFLQGGLSLNIGDFVNYLGFRAGFAF